MKWTAAPYSHEISSMWQEYTSRMDRFNVVNGFPSVVVGTGVVGYDPFSRY